MPECDICGKEFDSKDSLKKHKEDRHTSKDNNEDDFSIGLKGKEKKPESTNANVSKSSEEISIDVDRVIPFLKKYGPVIALIVIFSFSYWTRVTGFFNPNTGEERWPYLRNIDSYWYKQLIDLTIENGGVTPGEGRRIAYNNDLDNHSPYVHMSAWAYMAVGSNLGLELWEFLIYWPAFLAALTVVPLYFIGKYLYDKKAGVLAALFVGISPILISRTLGGDPDTTSINLLLAMVSFAVFVFAYKKFKTTSKKSILGFGLVGAALGIFGLNWPPYWYAFWVMLGTVVLKIIIDTVVRKAKNKDLSVILKEVKFYALHFVVLIAVIAIITVPFVGLDRTTGLVSNPLSKVGIIGKGIKGESGMFPNVYVSVAELQAGGQLSRVINRSGGVMFWLGMLSILYLIPVYFLKEKHLDTALFILIWVGGLTFATVVAIRFASILTPALVVGSSIILSKLINWGIGNHKKLLE